MNKHILNTVIQKFINENLSSDINALLLKKHSLDGVDIKEVIEQIEAKKRCLLKLPTWYHCSEIYYPNKLNIEQTSSEVTADYKSSIIDGHSIIDLTGGFGVDCFYFSKRFSDVTHCEISEKLSSIAEHNYERLQISNAEVVNADGINYLKKSNQCYDWIYIDPSRRHNSKGKVFYLNDCLPNVPEHLDLLFEHSNSILVKTSPMLDITIGMHELEHVTEIHVVAVDNEVKELLFILKKNEPNEKLMIKTINIKKDTTELFDFYKDDEVNSNALYSNVQNYLYEPNASILKAGAFNSVSNHFKIGKLNKHSHLYTSNDLIDFPGRKFIVQDVISYSKKNISKTFKSTQANISTRNFPESVAQIRKKFSIKDGGETYLFFTTDLNNNKIVIQCIK